MTKLRQRPLEEHTEIVEGLSDGIAKGREALPLTPEEEAELNRRLGAYEIDKDRGRPAADVLADVRRCL
ncbi:MAG TPA: addiction module protein [Steroidobacteraceae bacterium]|jgi:putative addiction module component (TIGR02574 family)